MASSLHTMRTLARRLGVVVAFVFALSSLQALFPAPVVAAEVQPMQMEMHDMHHHHEQQPDPAQHDHGGGSGACCLTGHHCSSSCALSLLDAEHAIPAPAGVAIPPVQLQIAAISRPLSPPRRPPKG